MIKFWIRLVCLSVAIVFFINNMSARFTLPWPHFEQLQVQRDGLRDCMGIVSGFRSLTADLAWIDFLQYVGGAVLKDEDTSRSYDLLKYFVQRIIRIDPYYHDAVTYGAGMLAWFKAINRPNEALELLEEAINYDPKYWPYYSIKAAIIYKESYEDEKTISTLIAAVQHRDCPIMIKQMLANIYKKNKEYRKAIEVWETVLVNDKIPENISYAETQIKNLNRLMARE